MERRVQQPRHPTILTIQGYSALSGCLIFAAIVLFSREAANGPRSSGALGAITWSARAFHLR